MGVQSKDLQNNTAVLESDFLGIANRYSNQDTSVRPFKLIARGDEGRQRTYITKVAPYWSGDVVMAYDVVRRFSEQNDFTLLTG